MFKMASIGFKLFLSLTLTALAAVSILTAMFWFGLALGFNDYVARVELKRLDPIESYLLERYRRFQGWGFVKQHGDIMPESLRGGRGEPFPPPPRGARSPAGAQGLPRPSISNGAGAVRGGQVEREPGPNLEAEALGSLARRLALFDAQGVRIMGPPEASQQPRRPLYDEAKLVGFVALASAPAMDDGLDAEFIAQQTRYMLISCLFAVLISALVALILARYFKRPITALAAASRQLAAGELHTRVVLQRRDELGELAHDFNRMAKKLEDFEVARRQWVADTSHELRTPLTILRVQIEAMRDGIVPFSPKSVASIESAIADLEQLVTDLYQLSHADLGAQEYQFSTINLRAFIADVSEHVGPAMQRAQLGYSVSAMPDLLIRSDEVRLHQVFTNLLANSMRYTHAGGSIVLSASAAAGFACIVLEDTAPGVPEASLPLLFERFYRVDASHNRRTGGSGLGLAICLALIKRLGGNIHAEHSSLGGLRIVLRLPLASADPAVMRDVTQEVGRRE